MFHRYEIDNILIDGYSKVYCPLRSYLVAPILLFPIIFIKKSTCKHYRSRIKPHGAAWSRLEPHGAAWSRMEPHGATV